MNHIELLAFLQRFGLSEGEGVLYLKLLEIGPSTVLKLSKQCKIKRSTVHVKIEELLQKGLVTESRQGGRRLIVAESPDRLEGILEHRKNELLKLEQHLPKFIQRIHQRTEIANNGGEYDVAVRYYEGEEAVKGVYKEFLKTEKLLTFVNLDKVLNTFHWNDDLFSKALLENTSIEIWEIVEASEDAKQSVKISQRRHHCYISKEMSFPGFDFLIAEEAVALVDVNKKNPSAVVISSQTISKGLSAIHSMIWRIFDEKKN